MNRTRFMDRLFSATEEKDEELTNQVAQDIEDAKANGSVDTDEVNYEDQGDGRVAITDKGNGEVTIAERAEDGNYDLYPAQVSEQIERYVHPEGDGVTPGYQNGAPDEDAWAHLEEGVIAPNVPGYGLNPQAGYEPSVEELAQMGPCDDAECCEGGECDEKEFSVSTDNYAVLKIFSDQEFCERVFSEVIDSEETAKVGDLKVEKDPEEANTVIVTNETTGDQAKVVMEDNEMEVTELESKNFSEEDQYEPIFVVGVEPIDHVIVNAQEYDEESAQELAQQLSEDGVAGVQIFGDPEEALDYAESLLENLGAESEDDIEEPEQAEYSDHTIYLTKFYSSNTQFMDRLFSEAADDIETSQSKIEDAIESGEEIENEDEIVTPIDAKSAIVEDKDNGEFTKVVLDGEEMNCESISKAEAEELTDHLEVESDEDDEEEKDFSDIWSNDEVTKFFSENEPMTDYMVRLYSDSSDSAEIEDAIESGKQIENDNEIITPVDSETAIIEDKENGEFTKAVMDDEKLNLEPISEAEADELTKDSSVIGNEERSFSDIWSNDEATKFFSENELMTDYMVRLYSDEASSEKIEDAIESGEQIENDNEIITPVDSETAIIEDKENGEFTKAIMDDERLDIIPISEEEADKLTDGLAVEDKDSDEEEKEYSYCGYEDPVIDKWFADAVGPMGAPADPNQNVEQLYDEQGNPVPVGMDPAGNPVPLDPSAMGGDPNAMAADPSMGGDPNAMAADPSMGGDPSAMGAPAAPQGPSVESIEDKAVAAVQQIQAAAAEAEATIMNAKAAPMQNAEPDLQEAQFSENDEYSDYEMLDNGDTLVSWLNDNTQGIY